MSFVARVVAATPIGAATRKRVASASATSLGNFRDTSKEFRRSSTGVESGFRRAPVPVT